MDAKLIKSRLERISNLDDRRMMKRVLNEVFGEVADYNMRMYEKLEKRIYDEIEDPLDGLYIYSGLINKADADPISGFFHPVIPEDLEDEVFDMTEMSQKISTESGTAVASIFLKCGYPKFNEIIDNTYNGLIKTDKNVYEVKVTLKQSKKYIYEIEKLYHIFQINSLNWNTLNCPYFYRFADVVLNSAVYLGEDERITEITVNLEENEIYKEMNVIPVWNVKRISLQDKSFPIPAKDRINNEHSISVSEIGTQNGYVIDSDNPDFKYMKIYENDLIIVSEIKEQYKWNVIQIENISNKGNESYYYEVLSNSRNLGFIGKFASIKSLVVRTKAEIDRIITSYNIGSNISFVDLEVENEYKKEIQTIDYNEFIDDNIRSDNSRKFLVIKFKAANKNDFLIYDKMSFLVSEIQILFPEYKCVGELI